MAENGEQAEIVYDDPGSVTDIRKKFGVQTKSDFITPKKFSLSAQTGVRSVVRPVPNAASSNGLSSTTATSPPTTNSFTQDFGQIINQGFELASKANAQPMQPLRKKPPLPQKPKKSPTKKSNFSIFDRPQNTDVLSQLASISIKTNHNLSFEQAVHDFYVSVQKLDPAIKPPGSR